MDINIKINLISVGLLILISALLSCFETSITAASRAKIHRLKNEGNKRAKILELLLLDREKVIGTMLLCNNAVNIIASVITTSFLIKLFGDAGLIYATISMTLITIIFAEITPKTVALKAPDQIALFFAPTINILVKIFFPITNYLQKIIDATLRVFFKFHKKSSHMELEEIRDTVDLKHKEGTIFKYDKEMIDGVLDLSDVEISEIMIHRKDIAALNIDLPISELIRKALELNHTRIALWQKNEENIIAILNIKKLLRSFYQYKGDVSKFDLKSVCNEPWFVPANNSLKDQLFAFRKHKKRLALVVDEYGSLQGLITLEDILEEIVGEIKEQDDNNDSKINKINDNCYEIAAKMLVRDINKNLNWDIKEDGHGHNLAGLIISKLGTIPKLKDSFTIDNYNFQITKKSGNNIVLAKIKKIN
jgi:Mg2+/Co2+ transporter CorB